MPSFTTSTSAQELMPHNATRKSLVITNEDGTDSIFLKFERAENSLVSSTVHDYKIGPGGNLSLNSINDGAAQIQSRITVIASANTPRVAWFETEDITR